jgi:hypothetical protein
MCSSAAGLQLLELALRVTILEYALGTCSATQ